MAPDTSVELLLNIPSNVDAPFTGTTVCRGRIVRTVASAPLEHRPGFAAAILDCESLPLFDPRRI